MPYEITVENTFDAAHCIRGYKGSCERLHGHTYRVRACFKYQTLDETGMAIDFRLAKSALNSALDYMDHQYINDLPEFSEQNPTAENVAKFVYDHIKKNEAGILKVSVWETPTS